MSFLAIDGSLRRWGGLPKKRLPKPKKTISRLRGGVKAVGLEEGRFVCMELLILCGGWSVALQG